jgi:type II secretory pathway pseudopilin PulG
MSLIESCVAAAVVATSVAVALPALTRTMDTYRLHAEASRVAAHMHSTRIAAITRSRDCRLSITSAKSYLMECQEDAWTIVGRFSMPERITIEANARPEFHRRGNVSPTATVTLRNPNGGVKRVIVNVNGRIRIQ